MQGLLTFGLLRHDVDTCRYECNTNQNGDDHPKRNIDEPLRHSWNVLDSPLEKGHNANCYDNQPPEHRTATRTSRTFFRTLVFPPLGWGHVVARHGSAASVAEPRIVRILLAALLTVNQNITGSEYFLPYLFVFLNIVIEQSGHSPMTLLVGHLRIRGLAAIRQILRSGFPQRFPVKGRKADFFLQ